MRTMKKWITIVFTSFFCLEIITSPRGEPCCPPPMYRDISALHLVMELWRWIGQARLLSSKSWNMVECSEMILKVDESCCMTRSHGQSPLCWEIYQHSNIWKMSLHDCSASRKKTIGHFCFIDVLGGYQVIRRVMRIWEFLNCISGWRVAKCQLPGNSARRSQTSGLEIPFLCLSH